MSISSVDIGNPAYDRPSKEEFEHDQFNDMLYNEKGKGFYTNFLVEGFWQERTLYVTKLIVETPMRIDEYTEEQVLEMISLRNNGKRIKLETVINYK
jgi:hypothetical protein